ncbi:Lipoprotein, partial [Dysosmobacter welbionis]
AQYRVENYDAWIATLQISRLVLESQFKHPTRLMCLQLKCEMK